MPSFLRTRPVHLFMATALLLGSSSLVLADPPGDVGGGPPDGVGHGAAADAPGHSGNGGGNPFGEGGRFGFADDAPVHAGKAHESGGRPEGKAAAKANPTAAKQDDKPNLRAELAGLDSLQRNVNGLMNSADPRMALVRDYIVQRAEYEEALAEQEEAEAAVAAAQQAYDELAAELGVDGYADTSPAGLQAELEALLDSEPPADDPSHLEWEQEVGTLEAAITTLADSEELANLADAEDALAAANAEVAEQEDGATDEDLMAALLAAANRNRQYDEETQAEILDWAKTVLGVGEADGTLDDYMAM